VCERASNPFFMWGKHGVRQQRTIPRRLDALAQPP